MTPSEMRVLGSYLRAKRIEADLSQTDVARALGYKGRQFVSNFERGACCPPFKKLRQLIRLYRIESQEITDLLLRLQRTYIEKVLGNSSENSKRTSKPTPAKSQKMFTR